MAQKPDSSKVIVISRNSGERSLVTQELTGDSADIEWLLMSLLCQRKLFSTELMGMLTIVYTMNKQADLGYVGPGHSRWGAIMGHACVAHSKPPLALAVQCGPFLGGH